MAHLFITVGWALAGFSLLGAAYALFAALQVHRFMRLEHPGADARAAVTILKPLHGSEPGLLENLESFCRQDYAAPPPINIQLNVTT